MNKQDEDKALKIAEEISENREFECDSLDIYKGAMRMAAWKEQQMIDRAKEFISTWFYEHPHTSWLICSDEFQDLDDCLERLEKEMED